MKRTLVLGLGNPILSDDGVGIHVARELKASLDKSNGLDIKDASIGGLNLLDEILDYDILIIVDAVKTKSGVIGNIYKFGADSLDPTLHSSSPHDLNFRTALEFGYKMAPERMPEEITIFAVEVKDVLSFGDKMTKEVEEAVPEVVEMVEKEILSQKNKVT